MVFSMSSSFFIDTLPTLVLTPFFLRNALSRSTGTSRVLRKAKVFKASLSLLKRLRIIESASSGSLMALRFFFCASYLASFNAASSEDAGVGAGVAGVELSGVAAAVSI